MTDASELVIRPYEETDQEQVIDLWHRCNLLVPWIDPVKDIQAKLKVQRELFLVGTIGDRVVATAMIGYVNRGWVNYLAVDPNYRRHGIGRRVMKKAEEELSRLGCPKINVQIHTSNEGAIGFYESIGFRRDDVISMGKRLGYSDEVDS